MKVTLFDFQETARSDFHANLAAARSLASVDRPQAISFSAPTGAGKTIVMTALFEDIFFGQPDFEAQPDAVVVWLSDMPELNEQTRLKIESKSDRIRVGQLVTIDATFQAEVLEGGRIYFINTGKLGTEKLLTVKSDTRQYTIWETFSNTARKIPDRFYVVIDEAHRGARVGKDAEKARTIMQRFVLGSNADGLCRMPLVIGVSATPQRFEQLLSGTRHTTYKVYVEPEDVRESGLIKDRVLIHYPEEDTQTEMTLLAQAGRHWQTMAKRWDDYCKAEEQPLVAPILVVQVEDKGENAPTKTDLSVALAALENVLGRSLGKDEVAQTFSGDGELEVDGRFIRHIEASRIEEDSRVGVVLFKMSLSTGWDCPRAEVMMSFRRAQDHTYIAQLLGRMVRTPLARRVEKDAALNDVHLFLPHYNRDAVNAVIEDLKDVEDVPPTQTGTSRELVTLQRRPDTEAIFAAMDELVTYRVNAVRRQSGLRRLMGLGRALTQDRLDDNAQDRVKAQIVEQMGREIERLRKSGELEQAAGNITGLKVKTVGVRGTVAAEEPGSYTVGAVAADIDRHFQKAGQRLSNGLHMEYWKTQAEREADEVKVEVAVVSNNDTAMTAVEKYAEKEFDKLYDQHKRAVARLNEERRTHYNKLRLSTPTPQAIPWQLPDSIPWTRAPGAPVMSKHLFIEGDGKFRVELETWEREIVEEELQRAEVVGWLRNLDRKPWSLEVPYADSGTQKPMFPDLLIVRQDSSGFQFDILEPHNPSLDDNWAKAVGLAIFAESHWRLFGRIQLIRKKRSPSGKDRFYRLMIDKEPVRKKVLAIQSNNQLDQLFDEEAV